MVCIHQFDVLQKPWNPICRSMQPRRKGIGRRTYDPSPILSAVGVRSVGTGRIEFVGGILEAGFYSTIRGEIELGCIGVMGIHVSGTLDRALLARGERPKECRNVFLYIRVIFFERQPKFCKLDL